jgi:hypothetical protein
MTGADTAASTEKIISHRTKEEIYDAADFKALLLEQNRFPDGILCIA